MVNLKKNPSNLLSLMLFDSIILSLLKFVQRKSIFFYLSYLFYAHFAARSGHTFRSA